MIVFLAAAVLAFDGPNYGAGAALVNCFKRVISRIGKAPLIRRD